MSKQSINEIAKTVSEKILSDLKMGVASWVKPWTTAKMSPLPVNGKTGHYYNGMNWLRLLVAGQEHNYESNEWYTFKQAKELGGAIKKGSKGTRILFCQPVKVEEEKKEEEENESYMITKVYTVFAREQIDGLPEAKKYNNATISEIDRFISSVDADIRHGGARAYFSTKEDYIQLPELDRFHTADDYYSTVMHELIHWTAGEGRLTRDMSNYAFEELVAELGAAFLCSKLGIGNGLQHSEYINHWIKELENDYSFITKAASKAQQAANYIIKKVEGENVSE